MTKKKVILLVVAALFAVSGLTALPSGNITQTQSRVKSMLLKLGVFLVAVGLVKLLVAFILRAREKRGKA